MLTTYVASIHTGIMRYEFVEQVKTFLRETPNYKDRMEEMRLKALISGATEQEFDEAVRDLTGNSPHHFEKPLSPWKKNLAAIDSITHVFFLIFAIGSISIIVSLMTKGSFPLLSSSASTNHTVERRDSGNSEPLVPQVYANAAVLNGEKVFSYPGSDVTLRVSGTPKREVFGFLPYWMISEGDNIPFTGLTTISFFGIEMDGDGNIVTGYDDGTADRGWLMWNGPEITQAIRRAKAEKIKTQITLKAFNNENIEHLVASDQAQKKFIANAIHMVNSKGLDGITLDFEYVGTPPEGTRDNFTRLVTNLNTELKRQIPNATLSVATYVNAASYPGFFDLEALSDHVDDFVIMGYDFHTPKGSPGPIAPMEGTISLTGFLQSYLAKVPAEKLILALAHYGYDWPISDEQEVPGNADMLSYAEIAAVSSAYVIYWDEASQTPFYQYIDEKTSQNRIVHFENTRSLGAKYDFINEKNLKGVGIWALGYDGMNNDLRSLLLEKFTN